jgi:hypothetical protein
MKNTRSVMALHKSECALLIYVKRAILKILKRLLSMKYKIKLADGTAHLVQITSGYFKAWHVWNVKFDDGKAVMLFKLGSEWMQRNEDFLEEHVLNALGRCIDKIIFKRKLITR